MKRIVLVAAVVAAAIATTAGLSFALDPAEVEAFLDVGMTDEAISMCNQNAAEVSASPALQAVCAKAKGGGAAAAPPATSYPSTPAEPAPMPSAPPDMPESDFPSAPSAPVPSAPAPTGAAAGRGPSVPSAPAPEFGSGGGAGLDASRFTSMLTAAQYQQLISMCEQNELKIMAHPNRDEILQACGTAKMKVYSENRTAAAPLAGAMSDLESSLKSRYDQVASFDLGKSRLLSLDQVPSDIEKQEEEKRAVREMWDAIVQQHAMENFSPAVSDQIIIWAIGTPGGDDPGFVDLIIDRVFKNEGNRGRQRWLGARLRMLTDRFVEIDPAQGENDVRVQNLTLLKEWMVELQKLTYYDNSVMVGMYKYKGNRESELYGSDANTENHFRKAIYYYDEGRNRADTPKAKASLDLDIAMICSRFRSENTGTLIEFYKKGFLHARRGLRFMQVVNQVRPELGKAFYRYDEPNPEITAGLQESYGHTLTGLIYNLYLAKDYRGVISQRQYTLDAGFDWENKSEVLLIFAESAKELAAQSIHSELEYRKYKEMALAGGSRAMKFVLRQYGGKMPPPGDANFCKVFNAYWNYLDGFGQKVEAKAMENKFGATCPQ